MLRWFRPLIVVLAVLAVLASGTSRALADRIDKCDDMTVDMVVDDCMMGDSDQHGTVPGCPPLACIPTHIIQPPQGNFISPVVIQLISMFPPRDDLERRGLSGPPDLRPPIV
ncbi:MAG: hypothetical protein ACR65X_12200 [Methylocystis sp.]